jgi:glycosyltransferase involved in cell wall biosynthesis
MRILLIAHSIATWTPYFARYFMQRGDEVLVASFSPEKLDGIPMEFIGVEPYDPERDKRIFFTRVPRLRQVIRQFQPDLVFAIYLASNGLSGALAWNGPYAVAAVGSDVLDRNNRTGIRKWFRESVIKFVCRRADIINTVSQELDDKLLRLKVPKSKLLQLPFGVDTEKFYPASEMPRPRPFRMICTRRHGPLYDIPTIIKALAELKAKGKTFHCVFTSDGRLLEEHKKMACSLGLQDCVTFTGNLEHNMLPVYLRQSDIYVSASLGDGTSVALLEAMACGLLPVVSRIPANLPWVQDSRTGLLFDPGNSAQLAIALSRAMEDNVLHSAAFKENRQIILDRCDQKKNMDRLAKEFEELIQKKKKNKAD